MAEKKKEKSGTHASLKLHASPLAMHDKTQGKEGERKDEHRTSNVQRRMLNKKKPATSKELKPVEDLAGAKNIKSWELAGLMRAAGWAPGKQVSEDEFDLVLDRFRKRPQGGGKI